MSDNDYSDLAMAVTSGLSRIEESLDNIVATQDRESTMTAWSIFAATALAKELDAARGRLIRKEDIVAGAAEMADRMMDARADRFDTGWVPPRKGV